MTQPVYHFCEFYHHVFQSIPWLLLPLRKHTTIDIFTSTSKTSAGKPSELLHYHSVWATDNECSHDRGTDTGWRTETGWLESTQWRTDTGWPESTQWRTHTMADWHWLAGVHTMADCHWLAGVHTDTGWSPHNGETDTGWPESLQRETDTGWPESTQWQIDTGWSPHNGRLTLAG